MCARHSAVTRSRANTARDSQFETEPNNNVKSTRCERSHDYGRNSSTVREHTVAEAVPASATHLWQRGALASCGRPRTDDSPSGLASSQPGSNATSQQAHSQVRGGELSLEQITPTGQNHSKSPATGQNHSQSPTTGQYHSVSRPIPCSVLRHQLCSIRSTHMTHIGAKGQLCRSDWTNTDVSLSVSHQWHQTGVPITAPFCANGFELRIRHIVVRD